MLRRYPRWLQVGLLLVLLAIAVPYLNRGAAVLPTPTLSGLAPPNTPSKPPQPIPTTSPYPTQLSSSTQNIKEVVRSPFTDKTLEWNIKFAHTQTTDKLTAITESLGSGACVLDYDNDGFADLFVVGGNGHNYYYGNKSWWSKNSGSILYRNVNGLFFEDASETAHLSMSTWGMGCAAGDVNNDGFIDLFITGIGKNALYKNNGDKTFTNITDSSEINKNMPPNAWSTSAAIADYDQDGLADIYVGGYINYKKNARTMENNTGFTNSQEGAFDAVLYDALPNKLLHNQGNLQFTDMAKTLAVDDSTGRTLSVAWLDANQDTWLDLLVINDKGSPSHLFINDHGKQFVEADSAFRIKNASGLRSVAIGDIDNDHDVDLVMSSPPSETPLMLINKTHRFIDAKKDEEAQFHDLTWETGIANEHQLGLAGWGNSVVDFNNDGWLDVFVGNGMLSPDPDSAYLPQGQPNKLWWNTGNGTFSLDTLPGHSLSSRGVVYADFNNDGDIDLFINHNNDVGQLLINNTSNKNHWVGFELVDKNGSRQVKGARITLQTASENYTRNTDSQYSFLSQSDYRLHVGLNNIDAITSATVTWPDGSSDTLTSLTPNQYWRITQDDQTPIALPTAHETTSVSLKAPFDQSPFMYAQWLIQGTIDLTTQQELTRIYKTLPDTDKLALLNSIKTKNNINFLPIVKLALHEKNDALIISGIQAIQSYKLETSVHWFLDLLQQNSSPAVTCQIAKTAEYMFREEEVVTHRKMLMIPALVHLLNSDNVDVVGCTARALAESRGYRATEPLLALLNNPSIEIRLHAIRALGWLREGLAKPAIIRIIENDQEDPRARAYALIASVRLADNNTTLYLKQLLAAQHAIDILKVSTIADILLDDGDDGLIVPRATVITSLEKIVKDITADRITDPNIIAPLLHTLALTHDNRFVAFMTAYTQDKNPILRQQAYDALLLHGSTKALAVAENGLFDTTDTIANSVFEKIKAGHFLLSNKTITTLINTNKNMAFTLAQPTQLALLKPTIQHILNKSSDPSITMEALVGCSTLPKAQIVVPVTLLDHADNTLKKVAWACAGQQDFAGIAKQTLEPLLLKNINQDNAMTAVMIDAMADSHGPWVNKMISDYLTGNDILPATVDTLFSSLAKRKNAISMLVMLKACKHPNADVRKTAATYIGDYVDNATVHDALWLMVNNPTETSTVRLAAANTLASSSPDQLIKLARQ